MNVMGRFARRWPLVGWMLALVVAGCATAAKVNWTSRVGSFSFDQAVLELGPPDKSAKLTDGTLVAEWLTQRGYSRGAFLYMYGNWVQDYQTPPAPEYYLRLTFGADGKLSAWKRVVK